MVRSLLHSFLHNFDSKCYRGTRSHHHLSLQEGRIQGKSTPEDYILVNRQLELDSDSDDGS